MINQTKLYDVLNILCVIEYINIIITYRKDGIKSDTLPWNTLYIWRYNITIENSSEKTATDIPFLLSGID